MSTLDLWKSLKLETRKKVWDSVRDNDGCLAVGLTQAEREELVANGICNWYDPLYTQLVSTRQGEDLRVFLLGMMEFLNDNA